jgi:hypothetical protein
MSISNDSKSWSETEQVVDLRDVMRQYDEMGLRPQGFVFMYAIQDASEVNDGTQFDTLMRSMAAKYQMEHRKRAFTAGKKNETIALVRHEMGWFGAWEGMAELIETIEADIRQLLESFVNQGSISSMPMMDFMFANNSANETSDIETKSEDDDLF